MNNMKKKYTKEEIEKIFIEAEGKTIEYLDEKTRKAIKKYGKDEAEEAMFILTQSMGNMMTLATFKNFFDEITDEKNK